MKWATFRHGLQTVHLWAGMILAIPFVLLGISGSILMLQPEVPRMAYPHAPARGEMRSIARILDVAATAAPAASDGLRASRVTLPHRQGVPAVVRYGQRAQRDHTLAFAHPSALAALVTGARPRTPPTRAPPHSPTPTQTPSRTRSARPPPRLPGLDPYLFPDPLHTSSRTRSVRLPGPDPYVFPDPIRDPVFF